MPGYFKKRKRAQGPNKNEQKVMRARSAENQTRLGAEYPSIKQLKIRLVFMGEHQNVIEEKNLVLGPADAAVFTVPCPGRCGQGTFDLEGKISETAAAGRPFSESGAKCAEALYAASQDACGCEVKCRMEIEYQAPVGA